MVIKCLVQKRSKISNFGGPFSSFEIALISIQSSVEIMVFKFDDLRPCSTSVPNQRTLYRFYAIFPGNKILWSQKELK